VNHIPIAANKINQKKIPGLPAADALSWPCGGINPYACFDCPTPTIASHILSDLEVRKESYHFERFGGEKGELSV
jgi:hypothetical protein